MPPPFRGSFFTSRQSFVSSMVLRDIALSDSDESKDPSQLLESLALYVYKCRHLYRYNMCITTILSCALILMLFFHTVFFFIDTIFDGSCVFKSNYIYGKVLINSQLNDGPNVSSVASQTLSLSLN